MKKWLVTLSIFALIILGTGCRSGKLPDSDPSDLNVQTEEDVQRISVTEAKSLLDEGKAILYDTRTFESYHAGHATGAISLPLSEVEGRHNELPKDKALIFYCT